jgi:hypothetical protein
VYRRQNDELLQPSNIQQTELFQPPSVQEGQFLLRWAHKDEINVFMGEHK